MLGILLLIIGLWGVLFRYTYRWRGKGSGAVSASVVDEVFHPSRRIVHMERERQLVLREDPESGAPPRTSIDLELGKAIVRLGPQQMTPEADNAG